MLSGLKEIIIVLCVLVGLFFIPRMIRMRKGAATVASTKNSAGMQRKSGLLRLAILLSLIWVVLSFVLVNPMAGTWKPFLLAGVLPVAMGWGIRWVVLGFK